MNITLSEKLIELDIATRRALARLDNRNSISLKNRILFILQKAPKTPLELISELEIGKTNLALITKPMIAENLISACRMEFDRRQVEYSITEKGKQKLDALLAKIDNLFKNILTTPSETEVALNNIDNVLQLLSFL